MARPSPLGHVAQHVRLLHVVLGALGGLGGLGALEATLGLTSVAQAEDPACASWIQQANQSLVEAERLADQGAPEKSVSRAEDGLRLLERAFEQCVQSQALCGQGVIGAVFAKDPARARMWLERFVARSAYGEREPELHYLRALAQLRLEGRPDLAVRSLERMQALAPRMHETERETLYFEALLQHGGQLAAQERYDEAVRQFQTAALAARRTERPRKERQARANIGITLMRAQRMDEAVAIFQQLRKEEPANPRWSYQHGLSLARLEFRYDEAVEAYRAALAALPGWEDAPGNLAELRRARLRLGNCLKLMAGREPDPARREPLLVEAEQQLRAFVAEEPGEPLGHKWLAILLFEERNDPQGALPLFEKAFQLDPDCENSLRYMLRAQKRLVADPSLAHTPISEEQRQAWLVRLAAWEKDLEEHAERRKLEIRRREALTGDSEGGCL